MSIDKTYWSKQLVSRRLALRTAAAAGGGLVALSLIGCSDDNDDSSSGGSNGGNRGGASGEPKPGGRLNWQAFGHPGTFDLFASQAPGNFASLVHSRLLNYDFGHPPSNGLDAAVEPDLASLPEQPDDLTYIFKLKPAKFHNGRNVVANDVVYSYQRYAAKDSIYGGTWFWFDKAEAPDPQTVVVKTKAPYADTLFAIASFNSGHILAKEFQEGPDVAGKMMGSGPFLFESSNPGAETTLRKNPDYFENSLPYFDRIVSLPAADSAKQVADFISKNTHFTYWFSENSRDEIRKARPDAVEWFYPYASFVAFIRVDQEPFKDKRVRQALSMAIDRKFIRTAVSKGEGEDDQLFSPTAGPKWGFRKPADLGSSAKHWKYDPAEAKKLLQAANVTLPLKADWSHLDAAIRGTIDTDLSTLTEAGWKQLGIADIKDITLTPGQFFSTVAIGDFNGVAVGAGFIYPDLGTQIMNYFYSPPGGVSPPTLNWGRVNDPRVNELFTKQLTQLKHEDRKATFKELEDIFADNIYALTWSTTSHTHFTDPSLRNVVAPVYAYYACNYLKNWGFA
jgi:peptide/nickel transport system substrate-binding protein